MVTDKDVKKIVTECKKIFVTKDELKKEFANFAIVLRQEFVTKNELAEFKEEMRANFAAVIAILDGLAKQITEMNQELKMHNTQLSRHERWHHETADTIGTKLEY